MTVLITGATGFIGRKVLELLLRDGHVVISLVRKPTMHFATQANLTEIIVDLSLGIGLDLVPWKTIEKVVHLAAAGVKASCRVWSEAVLTNIKGTMHLLDFVAKYAPQNPTVILFRTFYENFVDQQPALLENPYIVSKTLAYRFSKQWERSYPGRVVYATLFQVYGPGDESGGVLTYAATELRAGRRPTFGSGKGFRDWIFLNDAADAIMAIVNAGGSHQSNVDIGTGDLRSIREMVDCIVGKLQLPLDFCIFDPGRDRPDVEIKARATCTPEKWSPKVSVERGIDYLLLTL